MTTKVKSVSPNRRGRLWHLAKRIYRGWLYVSAMGDRAKYLRKLGMRVGVGCSIGKLQFGAEPWLIEIGNRVSLTGDIRLITHDGSSRLFRDKLPGSSIYGNRFAPVRILDESFIGARSIILPGVTIGPRSIVGAGSVVTKDVLPETVVAGVPARHICTLDEYVERYKEKMISVSSNDRESLRRELTLYFWGEER